MLTFLPLLPGLNIVKRHYHETFATVFDQMVLKLCLLCYKLCAQETKVKILSEWPKAERLVLAIFFPTLPDYFI